VLNDTNMYAAPEIKQENVFMYDQSEFVRNKSAGLKKFGWVYIPDACKANTTRKDKSGVVNIARGKPCRLLIIANNCNGDDEGGNGASFGEDDWPRYAEVSRAHAAVRTTHTHTHNTHTHTHTHTHTIHTHTHTHTHYHASCCCV
jgi:hypothetical protein